MCIRDSINAEYMGIYWKTFKINLQEMGIKIIFALLTTIILGMVVFFVSRPTPDFGPLPVAENFDVDRYMGRWYAIRALPNIIEKLCHCTFTTYTKVSDERVDFDETCRFFSPKGPQIHSKSFGLIPNATEPAKWINVNKAGPITAKAGYWILDVDQENYQWAIVGMPNRKGLWFLSRTITLSEDFLQAKAKELEQFGFDIEKLEQVDHNQECGYDFGGILVNLQ
eukprot:TRINITY_DN165_c0_g1_i2.p1 TRINITY_DN165_c0_g1~~TRINITY_DN165_c0_g1_i2.p1  ORF type:complete len:225 (-),score=66.76 TRINITY_DN165_c0_g1_i2:103-777(-)